MGRIGLCTHACSSAVSRVSRMLHLVYIIIIYPLTTMVLQKCITQQMCMHWHHLYEDLLSWVYSGEASVCRYKRCCDSVAREISSAEYNNASIRRCTSHTFQTSLSQSSAFMRIRQSSGTGWTFNETGTFIGIATRNTGSKASSIQTTQPKKGKRNCLKA